MNWEKYIPWVGGGLALVVLVWGLTKKEISSNLPVSYQEEKRRSIRHGR